MLAFYLSIMDNDEERSIFAELYEKFYHEGLFYAYNLLNDKILAEDAVHEAFLDVIRNRKKHLILPRNEFRKLFTIIVRCKSVDIIRKENREKKYQEENSYLLQDTFIETSAEEEIIQKISIQEMSGHLDNLDEISRQVIYMKYVRGMSYKDIGLLLDMKVKTVEVRLARAKKKIRDIIKAGDDDNE